MGNDEGWDKKTIALAAFILFGSGSGIGNLLAPGIRSGSFTEADFLIEKEKLIFEIEELRDEVEFLDHQTKQIVKDDKECRRRQEAIEKDAKWLRELVTNYQSATKQVDAHQSKLIADCMRRTQ